jgi:hypothetical protein
VNGQRCRAEVDLKQGVAAIDEQSPARGECRCDSGTRLHAGLRLTSVECAHADREREVEQPLAGWQFEVLGGDLADAQPAGRDLRRGVLLGSDDPGGGSVDDEDVPVPDSSGYRLGGGSRSATDLQDAHAGLQRQGVHHRREPFGQPRLGGHARWSAVTYFAGPTTA